MNSELLDRIVSDPAVMAGKPVIRGTRMPVDLILRLLSQGQTMEEILQDYPHLTREDLQAALAYGAEVICNDEVFPFRSV